MNTAYSQEPYRPAGPVAYASAPMHNPQYNPMPVSRPPMPEPLGQPSEVLASLAPGTQPTAQEPLVRSCIEKGWKYELAVVQQPQRARMCGFGDKDRRPITPPPCVRLIITDVNTGKECDVNDIDHGMFVLNVDLWSADGQNEVNLVRHSQTSPSISMTAAVSYAHVEHGSHTAFSHILPGAGQPQIKFEHGAGPSYAPPPAYPNPYGAAPMNQYSQPPPQSYGNQGYPHQAYAPVTTAPQYAPQNGYAQQGGPPPNMYYPQQPMHNQQQLDFTPVSQALPSQNPMGGYGNRSAYPPQDMSIQQRMPQANSQPAGMFTRNLIGSLAASAFRLTDPDDRIGIWFVLQDLSVRTEGTFRLHFSFVNVGVPSPPTSAGGANGTQPLTQVNTGKAPVLAACYSECFTVYSAKRFPGVVESTGLSKCFATQGIKIPIRKDGQGTGRQSERDKEYDED